ncbi:hypothetical protein SZ64_06335 [Erythrobacter sp. SG61-1L]|uniref:hypothetical protein n=1 Tax=Erythrobacter sp. SG61-1L TaxID=1603897 RepID=UPI0006C8FD0B|nr:hypothetical protein [Erythrobacter sp. SG61-1L]KPL67766.1 hypothetical protein SZ64_06335 [Erythrobacter sp. SG61-1L]
MACLLSACWLSEKPLLTAKTASGVDFTGTYRALGEEERSDLVISTRGKHAYEVRQGEEKISTRYLKLRGDWYLAQYKGKDEEERDDEVVYLYQPMRAVSGRLYMYSADCDDTPGEFRGMKREKGACSFTSLDGLKAAALAFIGRIEKGEIADDPQVWVKVSVTRH